MKTDKKPVDHAHALEIAANHRRRQKGGEDLIQTEKATVVLADLVLELARDLKEAEKSLTIAGYGTVMPSRMARMRALLAKVVGL